MRIPPSLVAALTLAMLASLAACGDDDGATDSSTPPGSSSTTSTTTGTEGATTAPGGDSTTVLPPPTVAPSGPTETPVFTERSRIDRDLTGGAVPSEPTQLPPTAFPSDWSVAEPLPCCDVRFVVAHESDVTEVHLIGSHFPLLEPGISLALDEENDDRWVGTVCMPLDYPGTYYYLVTFETEFADFPEFTERHYNPAAPVTDDILLGRINVFDAGDAETCEDFDPSPHETLLD